MRSVACDWSVCLLPFFSSIILDARRKTENSIITKQKKVAKLELVLDCWLILGKR